MEQVLSFLYRLNEGERRAVREELENHIEDHMQDLLDLGYGEELAEARTMNAMGDPEKMGRELNRQYPIRWSVLKAVAGVVLVWALFLAFVGNLDGASPITAIRSWREPRAYTWLETVEAASYPELQFRVGHNIVRVLAVNIGVNTDELTEYCGERVAEVYFDAFDRWIIGRSSSRLPLFLENERGECSETDMGKLHPWRGTCIARVPVVPGDTHVTVRYRAFGEDVALRVPLPEVTAP